MNNYWNSVRGFQEFSLCDWAGKVSAVLFTGGCNFRCPTCHNWDLAMNPKSIESISRETVMTYLNTRTSWLDGVVITGGEPTLVDGLDFLLMEIQSTGLPVNLHTNGFRPQVVRELLEMNLVDTFSVDIKGPWYAYPELIGFQWDKNPGSNVDVKAEENLTQIFEMAVEFPERFYFRTTHVPTLSSRDIATCRSYLPEGHTLHIQEYRTPKHLEGQDELEAIGFDLRYAQVLVINDEDNKDLFEGSASEAVSFLRAEGIANPVGAIQTGAIDGLTIIDNL